MPDFRAAAVRERQSRLRLARWTAAAVVALLIVGSIGWGIIRYGGGAVETLEANRLRGRCMRNLEKIARAMNAYADDFGSYPPPVSVADDGTPLHSWRVLILPYLGYQTLYDEFDLDQPWDAPPNQMLVDRMPSEYRSPAAGARLSYETYYALVVGAETLFPPSGPLGPADVLDDPSKTLLVVESAGPVSPTLQWTEPGDVDFATLSATVGVDLGGHHRGGATAVTVEGRGQFLRDTLDPAVVRALITPQGGEGLPDDVLD